MKMIPKECVKVGDVIRVEYGDFDNFLTGKVLANEKEENGWYRTIIQMVHGQKLEMYSAATSTVEVIKFNTLEERTLPCNGTE